MAKKAAHKHVEPEESAAESAPTISAESAPTISKAKAVRQALAACTDSHEDVVGYLKSIHCIEMTPQSFSSYEAQEKARQAKKSSKGRPGRKSREVAEAVADNLSKVAPESKATANGQPGLMAALEGIKALVGQFGADQIKRMVDPLG